jgi:hypothetical protein
MTNKQSINKNMNKQLINKIINKNNKKTIVYADIETILIDNQQFPYAIGWVKNNVYYKIITKEKSDIKSYKIIEKFILSFGTKQNVIVYFHNMSNFDGIFIINKLIKEKYNIKIIEKNNIIYSINVFNIQIKDSYLLLPISLKKIGEYFCEKYKKIDYEIQNININNIEGNIVEIKEYLKNDVKVLQEGFKILVEKKFKYNIHNSLSLSSISFNIFRKDFYNIEKFPIYKNDRKIDNFIRQSYIGGITEVYKPLMINGYCYDVNSLYYTPLV